MKKIQSKNNEKIILEVIAKTLKVRINLINNKLKIGDLPEWDSVAHINIYFSLKKKIKKKIDFKNLTKVKTIKDWVNLFK